MNIPYLFLAAAVKACAHKDVRFYLEGVLVGNGMVAATNGHIAIILEYQGIKDEPEIIIPKAAIEWLVKKVKFTGLDCGDVVEILPFPSVEDPKRMIISFRRSETSHIDYEVFTPIDGKFPDVKRVLATASRVCTADAPVFSFNYLSIISKAKQILTQSRLDGVQMFFNGANGVTYVPMGIEDCHGLIMPMRS